MNKLKIGNKVELKPKSLKWHTDHFYEVFNSAGQIKEEDYEDIAILLLSKARKVNLRGKVVGYGSKEKNDTMYVKVVFRYKGMKTDFYCSENELKRI